MRYSININEYVTCTLTIDGVKMLGDKGFLPEFNGDRSIKMQLWELMQALGDGLNMGADQLIVDNTIWLEE